MTDIPKITEIIPSEIFKDPDLEWARIAFEEGNFFNVVVERIRKLERENKALKESVKHALSVNENWLD